MLVEQGASRSVIKDNWKYIRPANCPAVQQLTAVETGCSLLPQLYNLADDIGEKNNLAEKYPGKVKELETLLKEEEERK